YQTAKLAVTTWIYGLARRWADRGVTANVLDPGIVKGQERLRAFRGPGADGGPHGPRDPLLRRRRGAVRLLAIRAPRGRPSARPRLRHVLRVGQGKERGQLPALPRPRRAKAHRRRG